MLVLKPRHGCSLALSSVLFVLQLSSCDSSNGGTPSGSSGMSFTVAGQATTAGSSGMGVAGSGPTAGIGGASGGAPGSAGALSSGGVGGQSDSGGSGGMAPPCTDIQNPDHAGDPCSIWPDYDSGKAPGEALNCDASWLTGAGYCLESCGKCSSGSGGAGGAPPFSTGLGPGPALPDVSSGTVYWASRYWDCCKPHCSTNGNVPSCGADGVSKNSGTSACSGGSA